mgnify:CR=1 FL=1
MNLDFQAGGSPLASRQNPVIYAVLIVGAIIIAVFFLIWFILKVLKERKATPEWIQKEAERCTKKKDVLEFAEKYLISKEEADLLWRICRKYKIQNILYTIKHYTDIDGYFKTYYDELRMAKNTEREINNAFKLKFNLEKIFAASERVSSSHSLVKEQRIAEIFPDGSKLPFKVADIKKEHLAIEITQDFYNSETKPKSMEKIAFTFNSATGMSYAFLSRLLRYEQTASGKYLMFVSHSSDLIMKQQRNFKRATMNEKCRIASVKSVKDKKDRVTLVPSESKIDCALINISGGGCCISTTLPVKEGQAIYTEFDFESGVVGVMGKIIKTRKAKTEGLFNLHICFTQISIEDQNKILAKVYSY